MRIYLYGYLIAFMMIYASIMLNALLDGELWQKLLAFYTSGTVSYEGFYSLLSLLLFLSAVLNFALLPLLNKPALVATLTHMGLLVLHRPLLALLTKIFCGELPSVYMRYARFLIPLSVVFAAFNVFYFLRRHDLFERNIVHLVTGQEKDEITSIYR